MKRLATPRSWPIHRKESTWITSPNGGHKYDVSIPVNLVFIDLLKLAKTRKESRYIIFNKGVLINGRKIKSEATQFGLFDILTIPETKESYSLLLNTRGKLQLKKLSDEESKIKLCKIVSKKYLGKKKIQLNLFGGMNLNVEKDDYSVGDSLFVSLDGMKIKEHFKLEKGALVYFLTGKNISKTAIVESIDGSIVVCKSDDNVVKVHKDVAYVVGKGKPAVNL